MSLEMDYLRSCGISSGSYKKIFTAQPRDYPKRVGELVQVISQRITDGRSLNFKEWKTYAAIDYAVEVPFQQTTPTMINHILSRNLSAEETMKALESWGLKKDDLFLAIPGAQGQQPTLVPNPPVFFQIFIPICKAYLAIREAKLFNERNGETLLPYKPLKGTSRNQVLCEVITDLAKTISGWYGYSAILRQAIKHMLKYGIMISFPEEEWHREEQERLNESEKSEVYIVREGIRYIIPHPTRMFYDMSRPLTRINTDTGCEWMGHWFIRRYGDIVDNRNFWNRNRIFCGTNWLDANLSGTYFQEFYPCQLKFPIPTSQTGPPLREDKAAWYTSNNRDQAVFLTDFMMKLTPSNWDLGEYKGGKLVKTYNHPVWHRFIIAGDNSIVWAAPCAYNPCWFMGYDYDECAGRNSSLGLETIPWQDHVGNILSQIILTAKQNLANVTFYDSNVVNREDIIKIQNQGEMKYRGMQFIEYDSLKNRAATTTVKDALYTVQLGKANIVELLQMLPMVLNIMERVLQISAQEAGAAASHQQSKEEIVQTGGASTNRVVYTGACVDEGMDAWKRQLYDGMMAYMKGDISAEVSSDIPDLKAHLAELGFQVTGSGDGSVMVQGHKRTLRLEGFAATNKGDNPAREKEMAQVIFQTVGVVAGQPELFKQVGAQNLLSLLEEAAKMAGAPADFRLRINPEGKTDEEIPQAIQQAIMQAQQATMQAVEEKVAKPAAQEIAQDQQKLSSLEQVIKQLQGIYQIAAASQDKAKLAAEKTRADIQRRDLVTQKGEQRKDAVAAATIRRKQAESDANLQLKEQEVRATLALEGAKATHGADLAERTAKAESKV